MLMCVFVLVAWWRRNWPMPEQLCSGRRETLSVRFRIFCEKETSSPETCCTRTGTPSDRAVTVSWNQCDWQCEFDWQVSGAAAGVSAVGSTADVLSQRAAAQHRRTGRSQSQARRRHQLTPAGERERRPEEKPEPEPDPEPELRALQHTCREDGREGAVLSQIITRN